MQPRRKDGENTSNFASTSTSPRHSIRTLSRRNASASDAPKARYGDEGATLCTRESPFYPPGSKLVGDSHHTSKAHGHCPLYRRSKRFVAYASTG